jgi:tetratricopeptide (TPR) repeat protein
LDKKTKSLKIASASLSLLLVSSSASPACFAQTENQAKSVAMATSAMPTRKKPATSQNPRTKARTQDDLSSAAARASYPRTHFEKGLYYKQIRDLNDALIEFLKATQENPRLVRGFYEQALIFRERGYLKLAESALEQALAAKPDYSDARVLLATVRIQQGNVGGAVQELSRTLGLNIEDERIPHKGNSPAVPIVLQSIHTAIKQEPSQNSHSALAKPSGTVKPGTAQSNSRGTDAETETTKTQNAARRYDLSYVRDSIESALRSPFSNKWHLFPFTPAKENPKDGSEIKNPDESVNNADSTNSEKKEPPKRKKKKAKSARSEDSGTTADTAKEVAPKQEKRKKRRFHFRRSETENLDTANKETNSTESSAAAPEISDLVQSPQTSVESRRKSVPASSSSDSAPSSTSDSAPPSRRERVTRGKHTVAQAQDQPSVDESDSAPPNRRERSTRGKHAVAQAQDQPSVDESRPLAQGTTEATSRVAGARTDTLEAAVPQNPQGNKLAFQLPNLEAAGHGLFNSFAQSTNPSGANPQASLKTAPSVHLDGDSWAKKMKYLLEHGTNSLKDGEAFMFSEETGEGVLFLGDGQVIRRTIAEPRDAQDVVRERRPDIIAPAEVLYNLSLLGKLMPKNETAQQQQPQQPQSQTDQPGSQRLAPPAHGDFKVDDLMGNSQGFWGWLKSVLKL